MENLLVAGALLHDIGKVYEYTITRMELRGQMTAN